MNARKPDPEMEWTEDEKRQIRALADSVAAVRLAQVGALAFIGWYLIHADGGGVLVATVCLFGLQWFLPHRDPGLERRAAELEKRARRP